MPWRMRIALWVGLVVLFASFYYFFQPSQQSGAPVAPTTFFRDWFPLLFLLAFFVVFLFILRRAVKGVRLNNEGVALMQKARYLAALQKFEAALPLWPTALIPYNIGVARLNLWQVAQAQTFLEKAWKGRLTNLKHLVAPYMALATAVEGRVEASRKWLGEATARGTADAAGALLAESVLSCRAGDWAKANGLLQRNELNALGGPQRGLREALRAWCMAQGGESRPVDKVALFGEASPDGFRTLWPEFVTFVEKA